MGRKKALIQIVHKWIVVKKIFSAKDYEYAIPCKVEGYDFPIPCGYNNLLTQYYGDYMKLPPENQRGQKHSDVIWDPDVPYKLYIDQMCK